MPPLNSHQWLYMAAFMGQVGIKRTDANVSVSEFTTHRRVFCNVGLLYNKLEKSPKMLLTDYRKENKLDVTRHLKSMWI